MKRSGSTTTRSLAALACLSLAVGACADRAIVVGEWIVTRKGADAGAPDTVPSDTALPPPAMPPNACVAPAAMPLRRMTIGVQELSRRLAWYIWRSEPDAELLARAANAVDTRRVKELAQWMLTDLRRENGADALARSWLKSDEILTAGVDPALTPVLRQSMANQTKWFMDHMLTVPTETLRTLLTGGPWYFDQEVTPLYGVGTNGHPGPLGLPEGQRSGVLTMVGLLAARASAPKRGAWVQSTFYCTELPAAPPGPTPTPTPSAGETQRVALERSLSAPACRACHQLMDVGFAFEHYDQLGRYRTTDNGAAVDSRTRVFTLNNRDFPVEDALDLGPKLANDCEVQACVVRSLLKNALGRQLTAADEQSVSELSAAFVQSGFQVADLFVSMTESAAFQAP